jgi:hypothetical protein
MRRVEALTDYQIASAVDFDSLPSEDLEVMVLAGQQVVEIYRVLAKTGDNVVGELLRGTDTFFEWDHYPKGDVYDRDSGPRACRRRSSRRTFPAGRCPTTPTTS